MISDSLNFDEFSPEVFYVTVENDQIGSNLAPIHKEHNIAIRFQQPFIWDSRKAGC